MMAIACSIVSRSCANGPMQSSDVTFGTAPAQDGAA